MPRVLLVDDNVDAAEMLAALLDTANIQCAVAHDGAGALEVAASFLPDVAILDIGLPLMDGYELGARLRTQFGAAIRLVALTGYGQDKDRIRSLSAGFEVHLTKPVKLTTLLEVIGVVPPG